MKANSKRQTFLCLAKWHVKRAEKTGDRNINIKIEVLTAKTMIEAEQDLTCQFCGDIGYDKEGMKWHLLNNCDAFADTDQL